jgi:hypothetical protein
MFTSDRAKASLLAIVITAVGLVLLYAFPNADTYVAAPGFIAAFILNGGVHGSNWLLHNSALFITIAAVMNFLCYFVASFALLKLVNSFRNTD